MKIGRMKQWLIVLMGLTLIGCSSSTPTRYYRLSSIPQPVQLIAPEQRVLGLGPLNIPTYLDRKAMVTSLGEHELQISDLDQWSESLDKNIWRVLSQDLMGLGAAVRVDRFPFRQRDEIDLQVAVDFLRFERVPGDKVELLAKWFIREKDQDGYRDGGADLVTPCESSPDYGATARCMSEALAELGRRIHQDLKT